MNTALEKAIEKALAIHLALSTQEIIERNQSMQDDNFFDVLEEMTQTLLFPESACLEMFTFPPSVTFDCNNKEQSYKSNIVLLDSVSISTHVSAYNIDECSDDLDNDYGVAA